MIKRQPLVYLLFFIVFKLSAQKVTITNQNDGKPISDVFIYHANKTDLAYSDLTGAADLASFPAGTIYFQHPSFKLKNTSYTGEDLTVTLEEKIITYSDVVVSANKWEQDEESISQEIVSIDKKTIQFQNPQTSADLLAASGQVFVQKSQLGGGSPKLRGFSANSVLLVVDGVRMNNAIFRSGNLQNVINIDVNALESAEVVFGPGSVIYGSDALGGVMDFHTISPSFSSDSNTDTQINTFTRYSSAANERTGHLDFSVSKKNFTFFNSISFSSFGDLEAGSKRSSAYEGAFIRNNYVQRVDGEDLLVENTNKELQRFSGFDMINSISKLKFRLKEKIDLSYGFYFSTTSDIPRYDNLTETIPGTDSLANAEWYYGPQKWQMHNLSIISYGKTGLYDQAKLTLAAQFFEESRNDRPFGDDRLRIREEKVDMLSASLDFDKRIGKTDLYYGLDFYHNDISSSAQRRNISTGERSATDSRYPDNGSDFWSAAAYMSSVNKISEKWILNAGLRLNTVQLTGSSSNSLDTNLDLSSLSIRNSALNGSIGLVMNPNQQSKWSLNISTGFRAPNVDDVGKLFDIGNSIVVPNPDLSPEHSLSQELAYELKKDKFILKAVGFYSRLFNAIVDGPFQVNGSSTLTVEGEQLEVFAKVNTGSAQIYGGSLLLHLNLAQHVAFSQSLSFTGGKDLTNSEPLRHTTPIFGRSSVTFQENKLRVEAFMEFHSARNRSQIPSAEIDRKPFLYTENGSPAWCTFNLKSAYRITNKFSIDFGVENIFDQHYRPYSSGISAPGRNLIVAIRGNF